MQDDRGKTILIILLAAISISSISNAVTIGPRIYEQKDMGDPMLEDFTYSLSVDCTAAAINLIVMDDNTARVQDANAYLKYIDFSSPLIANGETDKDGFVVLKLPGDVKLMRGLFILVIEKKGFRNKEIHFDITGCLTNTSWIPPAVPVTPKPNYTYNPPPSYPPNQNTSGNHTGNGNQSGGGNQSANATASGPGIGTSIGAAIGGIMPSALPICGAGLAFILLLVLILLGWKYVFDRKKPWKKQHPTAKQKGEKDREGGDHPDAEAGPENTQGPETAS